MKRDTINALLYFIETLAHKVGMDSEMREAFNDLIIQLRKERNQDFEDNEAEENNGLG